MTDPSELEVMSGPVHFDLSGDGCAPTLDAGGTHLGVLLVRASDQAPWRIADQGLG